ncbi:42259_t:CDS:2, partial [Gigaspora margarita]
ISVLVEIELVHGNLFSGAKRQTYTSWRGKVLKDNKGKVFVLEYSSRKEKRIQEEKVVGKEKAQKLKTVKKKEGCWEKRRLSEKGKVCWEKKKLSIE